MKTEIENALSVLRGRVLWSCGRAADLASFQFGGRVSRNDFFGRPSQVGEYALHIQCAWRVLRCDEVLVGSRDLYYPAGYQSVKEDIPPDFDWDRQPNRRDELLKSLFDDGKREFIVQAIEAGLAGSLRISLSGNLSLDILPDDSIDHERWRLLRPGLDEPHFVVTAHGIETDL